MSTLAEPQLQPRTGLDSVPQTPSTANTTNTTTTSNSNSSTTGTAPEQLQPQLSTAPVRHDHNVSSHHQNQITTIFIFIASLTPSRRSAHPSFAASNQKTSTIALEA